jgi:hypothetical protein
VVAARIEALEPRLEDLSLALHPMRRLTRRRGANGSSEEDAIAEEAAAQAAVADELAQTDSGENVSQSEGSPEE